MFDAVADAGNDGIRSRSGQRTPRSGRGGQAAAATTTAGLASPLSPGAGRRRPAVVVRARDHGSGDRPVLAGRLRRSPRVRTGVHDPGHRERQRSSTSGCGWSTRQTARRTSIARGRRGCGTQLYNADILTPELGAVVVTAGEKKVMVLWEHGIPAVTPTGGCGNWKDEWTTRLSSAASVYIAFDPPEQAAAWKLAEQIGERALVAQCPDKPDDYILQHGRDAFRERLRRRSFRRSRLVEEATRRSQSVGTTI